LVTLCNLPFPTYTFFFFPLRCLSRFLDSPPQHGYSVASSPFFCWPLFSVYFLTLFLFLFPSSPFPKFAFRDTLLSAPADVPSFLSHRSASFSFLSTSTYDYSYPCSSLPFFLFPFSFRFAFLLPGLHVCESSRLWYFFQHVFLSCDTFIPLPVFFEHVVCMLHLF